MKINATKIEILLAEKHMTKARLATRSGMKRQNVSYILSRGTCEPRTAGKIATGLGVSVQDIIETEE